jgi:hypothetical protein
MRGLRGKQRAIRKIAVRERSLELRFTVPLASIKGMKTLALLHTAHTAH